MQIYYLSIVTYYPFQLIISHFKTEFCYLIKVLRILIYQLLVHYKYYALLYNIIMHHYIAITYIMLLIFLLFSQFCYN